MLTGESRLRRQVPPNLQRQVGFQVIRADMSVGRIRNAAITDLRYEFKSGPEHLSSNAWARSRALGGGDSHRPINRLPRLKSCEGDGERLTVICVVDGGQLGTADLGHCIRDRLVLAGTCIQCYAERAIIRCAYIPSSPPDAAVKRSRALRTRQIQIGVMDGFGTHLRVASGCADSGESYGKRSENGGRDEPTKVSGSGVRIHGVLLDGRGVRFQTDTFRPPNTTSDGRNSHRRRTRMPGKRRARQLCRELLATATMTVTLDESACRGAACVQVVSSGQ